MPLDSDTQCFVNHVDVIENSAEKITIAKLFTGNHGNLISTEANNFTAIKSNLSVATDECSTLPHRDTGTLCNKRKVSSGDPFDLCDDEEAPKEKYRPIQRKFHIPRPDVDSIGSLVEDLDGNTETVKNEDGDTETVKNEDGDTETVKNEDGDTDKVPGFENAPNITKPPDTDTMKVANTKPAKDMGKVFRVIYLHSDELLDKTNQLIRIVGRAELVHSLIRIYGLLNYLEVVPPRTATESEILGFHCPEYISCLRGDTLSNTESGETVSEEFGLSYDCPHQNGVFETASLICGASIVAAEKILDGSADLAINWYGGWHHAKRDSASGFCYMNDIVLCVLKLREKFERILYVDMDLHHGDGVEEAFFMTSKVMTVSFHKLAPGFFPGSGDVDSVGSGRGKFYSINVPLMDGIKDLEFFTMVYKVMNQVREKYTPDVLVLQCGADGLAEDPMASFNLTHTGMARCVSYMLSWRLPTVLLGGGGYNFPATAKCWTVLTSVAVGKKLPVDIPEHQHLLAYGPSYDLSTCVGNRRDCNTKPYLANLLAKISKHLSNIPAAHTS